MANGRLSASALSPIPGGRLRHDAAAAWNDLRQYIGERHGVWIAPRGPVSSYRSYSAQVYFWNLYQSGRGNLAARPGTSNHGWGVAVDVANQQMVAYIKNYGHKFGWRKTEAFGEWWHYNYVGGYKASSAPKRDPFKGTTTEERGWLKKLYRHREGMRKEERGGKGPKYYAHLRWARHYKKLVGQRATFLHRRAKSKGWEHRNAGVRFRVLRKAYTRTLKV